MCFLSGNIGVEAISDNTKDLNGPPTLRVESISKINDGNYNI